MGATVATDLSASREWVGSILNKHSGVRAAARRYCGDKNQRQRGRQHRLRSNCWDALVRVPPQGKEILVSGAGLSKRFWSFERLTPMTGRSKIQIGRLRTKRGVVFGFRFNKIRHRSLPRFRKPCELDTKPTRPKSLRSRERHTNRGLESWVKKRVHE